LVILFPPQADMETIIIIKINTNKYDLNLLKLLSPQILVYLKCEII
jgi:hypothetical protein